MFKTRTKQHGELAEARAEIARLRREVDRLVKSESRWIGVCAALAILVGALEGRFVPPELWTVRGGHRTDSASDETLRQMAERYADAAERAQRG
jgi:hypothetical protein